MYICQVKSRPRSRVSPGFPKEEGCLQQHGLVSLPVLGAFEPQSQFWSYLQKQKGPKDTENSAFFMKLSRQDRYTNGCRLLGEPGPLETPESTGGCSTHGICLLCKLLGNQAPCICLLLEVLVGLTINEKNPKFI